MATVKTILGNADGSFMLDNTNNGNYRLIITLLGYKSYKSSIMSIANQQSIKLPAIEIKQISKALKEVSVTAQKEFVEQKIDRTIVNVNALISNTGSNALKVLEKTPGVTIVLYLINKGANVNANDGKGVSVLSAGKESENQEVIDLIQKLVKH